MAGNCVGFTAVFKYIGYYMQARVFIKLQGVNKRFSHF
jgi:hypothetical protein